MASLHLSVSLTLAHTHTHTQDKKEKGHIVIDKDATISKVGLRPNCFQIMPSSTDKRTFFLQCAVFDYHVCCCADGDDGWQSQ